MIEKTGKLYTWVYICIFIVILLAPLIFMNIKKEQISEIDNRKLIELSGIQAFNWAGLEEAMQNIEAFLKDRVGFRSEMIYVDQIINDKAFGILSHPSYEYGKKGYIYFKFGHEIKDYDTYLPIYVDFIKNMQDYCQQRGASFFFALNPSKTFLYKEYLPDGVNYKFADYKALLRYLFEQNVRYIDLMEPLLMTKNTLGLPVCNVKYDAGHWNEHGAFYGLSAIMDEMSEDYSSLHALNNDEFDLTYILETSLPVSRYPINESVPQYEPKIYHSEDVSVDIRAELRVSEQYPYYVHYKNLKNPFGPKIFVFHGSHLGYSKKYIADQFSEAVFVYSYNMISELPYYFNLFQPDIVLYEVADRTVNTAYINVPALQKTILQPAIISFENIQETDEFIIEGTESFAKMIHNQSDKRLLDIDFSIIGTEIKYAYMQLNNESFDFHVEEMEEDTLITITLDILSLLKCNSAKITLISKDCTKKQLIYLEW